MAKAIPKRRAVKKKPKQLSSAEIEKFLKKSLKDLDAEVDERYEYAKKFMKNQDQATIEAVERLVAKMSEMAGPPTAHVVFPGATERTRINVDASMQERNFYYMAVRIILACAKMDIRIGKMKLPNRCVECGRKV